MTDTDGDALIDPRSIIVQDDDEVGGAGRSAERILNQDEIDSLLGFDLNDMNSGEKRGLRAIIDSAMVSYERLPMLEIIFDRLVRLLTTSLRNFTSDTVEVSLDELTSVRFGDYLNAIPLPAILGVTKCEEWDNYALVTVGANLIYSMVDVLLGGGRRGDRLRIEGRPYTTIEMSLVRKLIELVLSDANDAFAPLAPVGFGLERLETNPRFAAITRPANTGILVRFQIDMEERGGHFEILLPYATIEPIRELLLQQFMGEKFGQDPIWEGHLASELWQTAVDLDAVLFEQKMPIGRVMNFEVGQTLMLDRGPRDLVELRCGGTPLVDGRVGRVGDRVAVRVSTGLRRPKTSYASLEDSSAIPGEG
ncbi:flagellar motor switch protein FliM [Lutibaculum baratangense]|uniref:Flagellar motor switch protein FliM n=1 Tax=Lutibaculum baratangense AMV1 TaxID=631454 RepID=V4RNB8_9HYPH|nr:flagellar motor switch protein FliM [Lutibaculum baratangense]ESR26779.1 Flagellar motor switch protein FliM [Lutibaculum baratangense AMV1]